MTNTSQVLKISLTFFVCFLYLPAILISGSYIPWSADGEPPLVPKYLTESMLLPSHPTFWTWVTRLTLSIYHSLIILYSNCLLNVVCQMLNHPFNCKPERHKTFIWYHIICMPVLNWVLIYPCLISDSWRCLPHATFDIIKTLPRSLKILVMQLNVSYFFALLWHKIDMKCILKTVHTHTNSHYMPLTLCKHVQSLIFFKYIDVK